MLNLMIGGLLLQSVSSINSYANNERLVKGDIGIVT